MHKWYKEGLIHSPEHVIPTPNGFFGCDEDWYDAWYSADGVNWQFLGLADTQGCVAAACSPEGIIVSLTKDGKAIVYDENNLPDADTITYAQRIDRSMPDYGWSDIAYANGMFVATRRNYSFVSSDGINWTRLDTNYYFHQENVDITSDVINALATDFMKKEDTINPSQIAGDGTINSKLHIKGAGIPLTIQSTDADTVFVQFCNSDREIIGHLGVGASGPYYRQGINTDYYKILHEGNIADVIAPLEARIAELEAKLAAIAAEPWTFTAENGDEVTKNVVVASGPVTTVKVYDCFDWYNAVPIGTLTTTSSLPVLTCRYLEPEGNIGAAANLNGQEYRFTNGSVNDIKYTLTPPNYGTNYSDISHDNGGYIEWVEEDTREIFNGVSLVPGETYYVFFFGP